MGRPSPVIATGASSRVIAARLGVDLSALADAGRRWWTPVTTLPSADCRHAFFRLTFADGRVPETLLRTHGRRETFPRLLGRD